MDYITIIQGDDTNFLGDQFLVINFNTDIDLSGFTATFSLGNVTLTYGDLSGKNFEIILSDEITSNLQLGKQYGELKLIDTEKRIRTVTSVIPFLVRKGVNEDIKFVNNSLEVSMNINETVLDIVIETPGIARTEATRMMSYCNDAKLSAQNFANSAQNTHIQLNQDVNIFYQNISNLNDIVDNAYNTCEENIQSLNETKIDTIEKVQTLGDKEIALAKEQADIATEKTHEVSDTYLQAMNDIANAKNAGLDELESKKDDSISDIEDKRVTSIEDVNTTTITGKELLTDIANQNLYKWNLFDIVKKDHILSFDEKQGLELLGTYVYKTGILGERYGYPNFYEKCLKEYNESSFYILKHYIDIVGSLTLSDGIIGGFSKGTYFKTDKTFSPQNYSWQIVRKIRTGSIGTIQSILHQETNKLILAVKINTNGTLRLWLSSNGTSWNIAHQVDSTLTLSADTDYLLSLVFDGTKYILSFVEYIDENTTLENATPYIKIANSTPMISGIPFCEGNGNYANEPFLGTFDLKHCYNIINNEISWKGTLEGVKHQNGHVYYDISKKEFIDNIYNITGIAWYYGLDTENERIFLPRNDYYFQNGTLENVGSYIEAGLPDHNHNVVAFYWNYPGVAEEGRGSPDYGNHLTLKTTNASASNPIYGKSNTVQPPSTKLAVYMVVGNTTQKEAITDVIDITTTENDTIPLLSSKYEASILDEGAFVRSQNSWLSGKLYKTAYARIENQLSAGNPKIKVIEEDDMNTEDDYTDYFIIRQSSKEFKLPIRTGKRILVARKKPTINDSTWFNWYSDGWLEQGGIFPIYANWIDRTIVLPKTYLNNTYYVSVTTGHYNHTDAPSVSNKTTSSFHCQPYVDNDGGGWFTCGYARVPQINEYTESIYLYFKLANTIQNLQLLDVQEVINVVNSKADADLSNCTRPYVIEIYKNGYSWYRKWSDGFIEQGGAICTGTTGGWATRNIGLLMAFSSVDYMLITQGNWTDPASSSCYISTKTVNNFTVQYATNNMVNPGAWYACGY